MTESERTARLVELEALWRERFVEQPKLPSSALLTAACAMALGFGAVFFLIGAVLTRFAAVWLTLTAIFFPLSMTCGVLNRILAHRWYKRTVIPWAEERQALKAEIDALRKP